MLLSRRTNLKFLLEERIPVFLRYCNKELVLLMHSLAMRRDLYYQNKIIEQLKSNQLRAPFSPSFNARRYSRWAVCSGGIQDFAAFCYVSQKFHMFVSLLILCWVHCNISVWGPQGIPFVHMKGKHFNRILSLVQSSVGSSCPFHLQKKGESRGLAAQSMGDVALGQMVGEGGRKGSQPNPLAGWYNPWKVIVTG